MPRTESDREDLIAEATALVRRAEIIGLGHAEPIVAGFRRDGSLSVYVGADPVYHLDASGRLKRAYRDGKLYRSQGETLAELVRERTATATVLRRRDLNAREVANLLSEMTGRITNVIVRREYDHVRIVRRVPENDDAFWADFSAAVARMNSTGDLRLAPRFKGKR